MLLSNFVVKSDCTSHVDARLEGFTQPVRGSNGQFLLTKISLSKLFIYRQHLRSAIKIPTMENICSISIWLVGMPIMCRIK
jgi:hypothetical protein